MEGVVATCKEKYREDRISNIKRSTTFNSSNLSYPSSAHNVASIVFVNSAEHVKTIEHLKKSIGN